MISGSIFFSFLKTKKTDLCTGTYILQQTNTTYPDNCNTMLIRPKLLIFDVNGTLLDFKPIKVALANTLANELAFDSWFAELLHYSTSESITGRYRDFGEIATATLRMTAERFDKQISETKIRDIVALIKKLPPHQDVHSALSHIRDKGIPMVTLTNGSTATLKAQLAYAELDHFFENIFSVESVRLYKPHPATYHHVIKEMKISPIYSMLVSTHAWDLMGAQRAGLMTGFVQRPNRQGYPLMDSPTLSVGSLTALSELLTGKS